MYEGSPVKVDENSIHLIRKLRWMGMEDEAKIMQAQLAAYRVSLGNSVIGGPTDTD
jgi:hypothetical protein